MQTRLPRATLGRLRTAGVAAGLVALAHAAVAAQSPAAAGRDVAARICSKCHVVGVDQPYPPPQSWHIRSFVEIANDPTMTPRVLDTFITTTHWTSDRDLNGPPMSMPTPGLTAREKDEVIAYIQSLRRPGRDKP
jgi:hypothetical protein